MALSTLVVDESSGYVFVAAWGRAPTESQGTQLRAPVASISMLAARGGSLHVLHTLTMTTAPMDLAVDSTRRRVFVTTMRLARDGSNSSPGVTVLDARRGAVLTQVVLPARCSGGCGWVGGHRR